MSNIRIIVSRVPVGSLLTSLVLLLGLVVRLPAQVPSDSTAGWFRLGRLEIPASDADDARRLRQLIGKETTEGYLLRSVSTTPGPLAQANGLTLFEPEVRSIWNSDLPYTNNENRLWAGRGFNAVAMAGLRVVAGPLSVNLVPQVTYADNRAIGVLQVIPYYPPDLYPPYIPLWYREEVTIDMPIRFGEKPLSEISLGQSNVTLRAGALSLGVGTENGWWGPGIRNAIVLSSNAPGFPHAFLRTSNPIWTPIGDVEARWMIGQLETSDAFERPTADEKRVAGAAIVTLRPWWEPGLTVGMARSVYGPVTDNQTRFGVGHGVFTDWTAVSAKPETLTDKDQIFSAFARWVFPSAKTEIYGEWTRRELPRSLRDMLVHPNHSQGYTIGLQWARDAGGGLLRIQSEITNLEMSTTFRTGRTTSYYVSYDDGPGYTNEGRVIGASIGPGSSSQWIAGDYLKDAWRVGTFASRSRLDNDAFYVTPYAYLWGVPYLGHDISMVGGFRAGFEDECLRVSTEFQLEDRLNYLFQNWAVDFPSASGHSVNVLNKTLRLTISPRLTRLCRER